MPIFSSPEVKYGLIPCSGSFRDYVTPTALTSDVSACSTLGDGSVRPFHPPPPTAAAAGVLGTGVFSAGEGVKYLGESNALGPFHELPEHSQAQTKT